MSIGDTKIGQRELHGAYIESVDTSKPFGRIVENYARQKWWQGFYIGWTTAMIGVGLGLVLDKYIFPYDR